MEYYLFEKLLCSANWVFEYDNDNYVMLTIFNYKLCSYWDELVSLWLTVKVLSLVYAMLLVY